MASPRLTSSLLLFSLSFLLITFLTTSSATNSGLFREYLGAEFNNVRFSDVPINPNVDFHYILSFAIDYTAEKSPKPADGRFTVFWDAVNLPPSQVAAVKSAHGNVKVALSIAGDTVSGVNASFTASSVDTWVRNAVASLTDIINQYGLDGIDIDYEHFNETPEVFAECIGKLVKHLKDNGVVSFASIAPFADPDVQSHYLELWRRYGNLIDYVNFQFYAYDANTTVSQFLSYFEEQSCKYHGGKVLVSFGTDGSGGLKPERGFFRACNALRIQGKLHGIFVWSADNSKANGFRYEKKAQSFLASAGYP